MKTAVEAQLTKLGEMSDVSALAEVITKQAQGIELSKKEQKLIDESKFGQQVANGLSRENIKSGEDDTRWAKGIGTRRLNADVYNKSLYDLATQQTALREAAEKGSVAKTLAESETATGAEIEASDDGRTIYTDANGNSTAVNVKRIVSTKGGIKVELDNGNTVSTKDLRFGTKEEGLVYEMIARMDVTPQTANELLTTFKPKNIQQATMYFTAVPLAYQYGKIGYKEGLANVDLTDTQKQYVYDLGRSDTRQG